MIRRGWKAVGWLGIVLTLAASLGPPALDASTGHADKFAHLAGYASLMLWWAQLLTRRRWRLAVSLIAFGMAIEWLQGLTPDRRPDALDALANSAGVLLGWLAASRLPNLPDRLEAHFRRA